MFRIHQPMPGIYHAAFETQRDVAQTMMRLQEFYEGVSDQVRGQYLSLEEFLHHFTDEDGDFEYTRRWHGYNVPGYVVEAWWDLVTQSGELTAKEARLKDALGGAPGRWYLIATAGSLDADLVRHEVAHALYYLDSTYKAKCDAITDGLQSDFRHAIGKAIMDMGYSAIVIPDEIQAYLATSDADYLQERFGDVGPRRDDIAKLYRETFDASAPASR